LRNRTFEKKSVFLIHTLLDAMLLLVQLAATRIE